jgi:hypothetical protein
MWTAVIILGLGLAVDPLRLGLVAVVLARQRPMQNLVAFWLGGMVASIGLGVAVLVVFRGVALTAIEHMVSVLDSLRRSIVILDGGGLQITLGVLILLLSAGLSARRRSVTIQRSVTMPQPPPNALVRLTGRGRNSLNHGAVWPSFLVGLGSATPPVECVMLLTVIMASGAALTTQLAAFIAFTFLVLVLVEVPLLTYLATPQRTEAVLLRLNGWLGTHRRRMFQAMLALTGTVLLVMGVSSL